MNIVRVSSLAQSQHHFEEDTQQEKSFNCCLYFCAAIASIASFSAGAAFAWISPVLPKLLGQLRPDGNPLPRNIKLSEAAWCTSSFFAGAALCAVFCGYCADVIGRKNSLVVSAVLAIAGFFLTAFGNHLSYYYVGRSLNGFGLGSVYTVMPVYLSEIAEKENRDVISCFPLIFITVGMVFGFCLGPYVPVHVMSLINVAPLALFVLVYEILAPESPYFLVSKGNTQQARLSLMSLRQNRIDVVGRELAQICNHVQETTRRRQGLLRGCRRLCVAVALVALHTLSGIDFLLCYMQWIFERSQSGFPSEISSIVVGVVLWLTVVLTTFTLHRLHSTFTRVASTVGTTASLLSAGTYFLLKERNYDVAKIYWLPTVSLALFVCFYCAGIGPMPFAVIGIAFPPHIKMVASALTIFVALAVGFLTTTLLPFSCDAIGISYTFYIMAGLCLSGGVYVCVFLRPAKRLESTHHILLSTNDL